MFVQLRVLYLVAAQLLLLHTWASEKQQAASNTSFAALDA